MDSFDPDAFLAQANQAQPEPQHVAGMAGSSAPSDFDPDAFIADANEEKYGGLGQQAKAGLEGIAKGVAGPLAPLVEKHVLGINEEDIKGRQETNPITHGVGEAAGLAGSLMTGVGQGRVMTEAGQLAMEATGLANLAKESSLGFKIGSSAVQQAAEMAVWQGSDEVSKTILNDPEASAESAISNIGLAAALGAGGGAAFTGVVSPLWSATGGKALETTLNMVKNRVNGGAGLVMPEAREQAIKTLGIDVDPITRAALSDDVKARDYIASLKRGESRQVAESLGKLETDASHSVATSLGLNPEDVLRYDQNTAGHSLFDSFEKEYKAKYQPIADALEKRNAEAAGISLSDDAKLDVYNKILEKGMTEVLPGSEAYNVYKKYAERVLPLESIGQMDQLRTELYKSAKTLGKDLNDATAIRSIRDALGEFQENLINKLGRSSEKLGVEGAEGAASDLLNSRSVANKQYAEFAKMSDELSNHLGTGEFKGFKSLTGKLEEKITAEQLLKKFSIRNNADLIPFLQKNFPETLQQVLANERQQLIKPAVLSAAKKGENPIDIKRLSDIINKQLTERSSYIDSVIPKDALDKIQAAKTLADSIPSPKDSGTPAGMKGLFKHMPTSALAAVGWFTGHNPLVSGLIGHTAGHAGMSLPEAYKLAYLRFLGSNEPIKSEGFKAMADFFHNTYKAENALGKASKAVFKGGSQVLASNMVPDQRDLDKLDKMVDKSINNPNEIMQQQTSGDIGHYLPDHQAAISKTTMGALSYLQSIKPQPFKPGPLDKPIPPTNAEMARYNRALTIAQQPQVVLQHIKDGTLQVTDIQDLNAMYPGLYKQMSAKLTNEMNSKHSDDEIIPYKTRMSLSLFMHQPLDLSMQPSSIMAAQPHPPQNAPNQSQGSAQNGSKGRPSALKGKSTNMYNTPNQTAERDRAARE